MPLVDLSLQDSQQLNTEAQSAYAYHRELVEQFRRASGDSVRIAHENPGKSMTAEIRGPGGTALRVALDFTQGAGRTRLNVKIGGRGHVNEPQGVMGDEPQIQRKIKNELAKALKQGFRKGGLAGALETLHQRSQLYSYWFYQLTPNLAPWEEHPTDQAF